MNEEDARAWILARFGRKRTDRVAAFLDLVVVENATQNLIAPSTVTQIWGRHALDSAQLLTFAPAEPRDWLDIGSGAGFPGMVIALLSDHRVSMVEPRRLRSDFLDRCSKMLGVNASVLPTKVEDARGEYSVISARAVAPPEKLLRIARHCGTPQTRWLLPRGRMASEHQDAIRRTFGGLFHVEHSLSDPASLIVVIEGTP